MIMSVLSGVLATQQSITIMNFLFFLPVILGIVSGVVSIKTCSIKDAYKEAALGTCHGYWECQAGTVVFKKCPYWHTFNSETMKCIWNPMIGNHLPCNKEKGFSADVSWCSKGKFYKAPVDGDCRSYYDCQDGFIQVKKCLLSTIFNPMEQECQLSNMGHNGLICPATEQPLSTPSNQLNQKWKPECSKGRNFLLVDPTDCSKYMKCEDGVLTSQQCGYWEKFDAESLECRWFNVKCSTTENLQLSSSLRSCVETNYFKTVKSDNCQQYFLCSDGDLSVQHCPDNTSFDALTHECRPSPSLNCSSPTEKGECKPGYSYKIAGPNEDMYYQCKREGTLVLDQCDNFKIFNPSTQTCMISLFGIHLSNTKEVEEWIAQAQQMFESEEKHQPSTDIKHPSTATDQLPLDRCGVDSSFSLPYLGDCHRFLKCQKGEFQVMECSYGRKFDNITQTCVDMNQCDLLNCYSKGPICYPGVTYRMPLAGNCNKYYECDNGHWQNNSCPLFHKFSPTSLQCESEYFSTVNCSAPTSCTNTILSHVTAQPLILKKTSLSDYSHLIDFKSSGWPKCAIGQHYKSAFPYDCSKFYNCMGGNLTVDSCPIFDKFDPKILSCRFNAPWDPVVCGTNPGKPECAVGQKYETVFPYDCAKYYQCNNGNLTVNSCSYFEKFDPKSMTCRFSWNPLDPIDCDSKPGEPLCTKGEYFTKVYPERCNRYYQCKNGSLTEEQCLFWQLFDPATLQCRLNIPYLDPVNCSATSGSGLGILKIEDATLTNTNPTSPPQVEDGGYVEPTCKEGIRFNAVYEKDCKKYVECRNGTEVVKECSWFKKFNPASLSCSWDLPFYRVNCSAEVGSALPVLPPKLKEACKLGKRFEAVDKGDCESYFSCDDGVLSSESCGLMKKFDPAALTCSLDLPFHRVNCRALPGEPKCPQTGELRKPYPGNCFKYYECNNGTLKVNNCGTLQKFDHNELLCKYELPFVNIDCGED